MVRRVSMVWLVLGVVACSLSATAADLGAVEALSRLSWRSIGPAVVGGRVTDIEVIPGSGTVLVGAASGGIWRSTNWGTTWTPVFDQHETASVGDLAISPSRPEIVWMGSGEANNRQSSPYGSGIYKSTDGGLTWQRSGLEETLHIGRVVVDPTNADVVFVAAAGHLWGPNSERGLFRTTNGGQSWSKVLEVDDDTGAIDVVIDPQDPRVLFVAMYQRRRTRFGFNGGGPGSGIFRSRDGGDSWVRLQQGLPEGPLGRIGLALFPRDPNLIYAVVEAQAGTGGVFRSDDAGDSWRRMNALNPRPMYFSQIRVDPQDPTRLYLLGRQLHVSDDSGETFRSSGAPRVHPDHHALWIEPQPPGRLILGGDGGVAVSFDNTASWRFLDNLPIAQFYAVAVDRQSPYWVYGGLQDNGSWAGPSATWDRRGILNSDWWNLSSGDGFHVQVTGDSPPSIYAESQRGFLVRLHSIARSRQSIRPYPGEGRKTISDAYRWNWSTPFRVSAHDPERIYAGSNHLVRSDDRGHSWREVSPDLTRQLERNEWSIMGSSHSEMLSAHDGIGSYGNLTTIGESALDPQLLYIGTDDGLLQRTRNGGERWVDLTPRLDALPGETYVSRVVASSHVRGRVYATFDGHRNDDYQAYLYSSEDFGETWRRLDAALPASSINVLLEDSVNPDLLFIGNEVGVFATTDRGTSWFRLTGLPTVPVDDLVLQEASNDLVAATHGRGIWILEDIRPLRNWQMMSRQPAYLFPVNPAVLFDPFDPQEWVGNARYAAVNPPSGARIRFWLDSAAAEAEGEEVQLEVRDSDGETLRRLVRPLSGGLSELYWDLRREPPKWSRPERRGAPGGARVLPGHYSVELRVGTVRLQEEIVVKVDPRLDFTPAEWEQRQHLVLTVCNLFAPLEQALQTFEGIRQVLRSGEDALDGDSPRADSMDRLAGELSHELDQLQSRFDRLAGESQLLYRTLEGTLMPPTEDQRQLVQTLFSDTNTAVRQLNAVLEERLPRLQRRLPSAEISDLPAAVDFPRRPR